VTAVLLGKDRFLAESARFYEKALLIAEGNRRPVSLGGAGSLTGAPRFSCKGGREGGKEGGGGKERVVRFWWEMEGGREGGMVVDVEGEASGGNCKGKSKSSSSSSSWAASEQSPLWASVTFEGGNKKVMGMRFWPLEEEEGGREEGRVRMPGKCRLMACSSPEGALFVEVGLFDLSKLVPEGGREGGEEEGRGCRTITGFNMFAAKTWKLEVLSVMDEEERGRDAGREGGVVRVGARVEFLAAEIEVDPLQILHVTTNLREVFQVMQGRRDGGREGGGGGGGGPASALVSPPSSPAPAAAAAAAAAAEGEEEEEEEEGATTSSSSTAIVMPYEDVRSLPLPRKLAWLEARTRAVTRRECNLARLLHRGNRQYYLSASQAVEDLQKEVGEVRTEGGRGGVTWWEWTLGQLARRGAVLDLKEELLRRLKTSPNKSSFPVFQGFHGLMMALKTRVDDLEETRKILNILLRKVLTDTPSEEEVKRNSACGVCRKDWGKTGPVCGICELDKDMTAYENKLYTYRKQGNSQIDGLTAARAEAAGTEVVILPGGKKLEIWKGTTTGNAWKDPCEAHRLLYTLLLPWLKKEANRKRDEEPIWLQVVGEGIAESKRQELLERERKTARRFWNSGYDLLSKLDEVACSAIRLELAEEGGDARHLSVDRRKVVVFPQEVGVRREEMGREVAGYEAELRERKKQLQYLENIAQVETRAAAAAAAARKARVREEEGAAAAKGSSSSSRREEEEEEEVEEEEEEENGQECPVCFESLVEKPVMVLPCAHHLCEACLKGMMGQRAQNKCPNCRRHFHKKDVARAERREGGKKGEEEVIVEEGKAEAGEEEEEEEEDEDGPEVEGSWGIKVTALVREVLRLPAEDKCLIFSEWDEMLDLVQEALTKNGVGFVRLKGERAAGKARREFREEEEVRCMLLNLKSGAKGLTLVEANHVFLLEPIFNAATEAQAVNRVYRIGQNKPTSIHRFVVRGTIEEKVERMRQAKMMAAGGESGVLSTVKKQGKTRRDEMELGVEEMEALFATAAPRTAAAAAAGGGGGGGGGRRRKGGGRRGRGGGGKVEGQVGAGAQCGAAWEGRVGRRKRRRGRGRRGRSSSSRKRRWWRRK